MNEERWKLAKSIFQSALELPIEDRKTYVTRNCDDTLLRDEVLKLVQLHEQETDFLESPLGSATDRPFPARRNPGKQFFDSLIGHRIDNFEIVRRIGSGGMGTVFEARQQNPQRAAAIKIMNPTAGLSENDLLRFEHEAEILAKLQNPGIAQVYAAGWHDFGRGQQPWFAMEMIDGQPLQRFSKQQSLTTKQNILLLLSICDAVGHAHSRGVIHRDLKPANILIVHDPQSTDAMSPIGQPKIVDFGVARVLDADRHATLQTAAGDILGTLNYMCPEQVTSDPSLIDERCDVYALGVIGYELLAGCLPHDRSGGSIAASLRQVEQDVPKLLGQINPSFRGDLQVIFDTAISKDPAQRYRSVQQFADDLRRFINHQPILARPASTSYRLRKFVDRHRALVGATAAIFAALLIGIVMYASEARQARIAAAKSRYEAEKATAINNFITNDFLVKLLAAANDNDASDRLPTTELINRAADKVHAMFGDRPTIEAAVRNEVATIYYNLNSFQRASEEFNIALQLWQSSLGLDHPDTLKAVNNLGQCYMCLGRRNEAEPLYRRALEGRINVLGESDLYTLTTMNNLAQLLQHTGRSDEAESMFRRTLALQRKTIGADHKNTLATMINLGNLLVKRKNIDEALALHRLAYESSLNSLGENHVMSLQFGTCYAQTLHHAGNYDEALRILIPVSESIARLHRPESGNNITARRLLARIYHEQGNSALAIEQLQSALDALLGQCEAQPELIKKIRREINDLEKSLSDSAPPTD